VLAAFPFRKKFAELQPAHTRDTRDEFTIFLSKSKNDSELVTGKLAVEFNSARIRKRIRVELPEARGKSFDDQISIVNHTIDYMYLYSVVEVRQVTGRLVRQKEKSVSTALSIVTAKRAKGRT